MKELWQPISFPQIIFDNHFAPALWAKRNYITQRIFRKFDNFRRKDRIEDMFHLQPFSTLKCPVAETSQFTKKPNFRSLPLLNNAAETA